MLRQKVLLEREKNIFMMSVVLEEDVMIMIINVHPPLTKSLQIQGTKADRIKGKHRKFNNNI